MGRPGRSRVVLAGPDGAPVQARRRVGGAGTPAGRLRRGSLRRRIDRGQRGPLPRARRGDSRALGGPRVDGRGPGTARRDGRAGALRPTAPRRRAARVAGARRRSGGTGLARAGGAALVSLRRRRPAAPVDDADPPAPRPSRGGAGVLRRDRAQDRRARRPRGRGEDEQRPGDCGPCLGLRRRGGQRCTAPAQRVSPRRRRDAPDAPDDQARRAVPRGSRRGRRRAGAPGQAGRRRHLLRRLGQPARPGRARAGRRLGAQPGGDGRLGAHGRLLRRAPAARAAGAWPRCRGCATRS